jgi:hypothetical protein
MILTAEIIIAVLHTSPVPRVDCRSSVHTQDVSFEVNFSCYRFASSCAGIVAVVKFASVPWRRPGRLSSDFYYRSRLVAAETRSCVEHMTA